jgi:hypothetical protein
MDWSSYTDAEVLRAYAELMDELRSRGICRSSNNPVADYTEWLVAKKLSLELRGNSSSGYDAVDEAGRRYQVKGRRLTPQNQSTQLSALRNLEDVPFDFLAAVVYNPDFTVAYAALVPHGVVLKNSSYRKHVNGHVFVMRRTVLELPGVVDISQKLAT